MSLVSAVTGSEVEDAWCSRRRQYCWCAMTLQHSGFMLTLQCVWHFKSATFKILSYFDNIIKKMSQALLIMAILFCYCVIEI